MGIYHPEVVHFAIALLFVGVAFRLTSFVGRPAFVGPASTTLLLLGTAAVIVAAYTGDAAHGPIEQMPGLRDAVTEHEEWGERARNIFVVVGIVELAALALQRSKYLRHLLIASAVLGVIGLGALYEAGEHGGRIVYSYAGGVGTRSGDPADVDRLYLAALYQEALAARRSGRNDRAAALFAEASEKFASNIDVQLAAAESQLLDRKDPQAALDRLRRITPPADNRFQRIRHGMMLTDALEASGQHAAAIATLQQLQAAFPNVPRIRQRLDQLQRGQP